VSRAEGKGLHVLGKQVRAHDGHRAIGATVHEEERQSPQLPRGVATPLKLGREIVSVLLDQTEHGVETDDSPSVTNVVSDQRDSRQDAEYQLVIEFLT
jgi:hypothetical protein